MLNSESFCKVILIGDPSVGKTSILSRFISNKFTDFYCETIGVDFLAKSVSFDDKRIKCQFWDASGSEKYRSIISAYFKGANGIIGVYDITNKKSFTTLKHLLDCYSNHILSDTTVLILGNKSDADDKRQVSKEDLESFINGNGFIGAEVSARFNTNLSESITTLVKQVYYKSEALVANLVPIQDYRQASVSLPKISPRVPDDPHFVANQHENSFARQSEFLNVNSNSLLLANSDSFYSKNTNRKIIADLVEQVAMLKSEVSRKDILIKELNSMDEVKEKHFTENIIKIESEANDVEFLNKELNSRKERCELLSAELEKANEIIKVKEIVIADLKRSTEELRSEKDSFDLYKYDNADKIARLEADLSSYEIVASKSELTINSLQADNNQLTDFIADLKSKNSDLESFKIEYEAKVAALKEELTGLKSQISDSLGIDQNVSIHQYFTDIKEKVKELVQETEVSKLSEQSVSSRIANVEIESKFNHETVERLVIELNKSETTLLALRQEHEALKITLSAERDSVLKAKCLIEDKAESNKKQLDCCQQELNEAVSQLERTRAINLEQENQLLEMNGKLTGYTTRDSCELDCFREEISKMLSDSQTNVGSSQSEIKQAIKCLMISSTDRGMTIGSLQEELGLMADQLAKDRAEKSDLLAHKETNNLKMHELENSIRTLQTNLNVTISRRDQLDQERSRFTEFFQKLAAILNTSYSFDLINQNSILKRIKDLLNLEHDANRVQNKLTSIDYEKKLKNLEEELSNKEIHMNLLRNRIVDLEEGTVGKVYGKSELKAEYNNLLLETKKQKVKIQKISGEYEALKAENTLLKAEAINSINMSDINDQNVAQISELNNKVKELSSLNDKNLVKVLELREQNDSLTYDLRQTIQSSNEVISNLSKELRNTKQQLIKTETREKQLLEFRHIVCQKLGLNISSVPLGEYEYVASIEDAINSSQMNGIMTLQQAQSQSLVDALSARPCHTCPSWSSCEACHSKCQCSCLCERHRAPLLEGSKYSCSNDKAININNISEKTFKYN